MAILRCLARRCCSALSALCAPLLPSWLTLERPQLLGLVGAKDGGVCASGEEARGRVSEGAVRCIHMESGTWCSGPTCQVGGMEEAGDEPRPATTLCWQHPTANLVWERHFSRQKGPSNRGEGKQGAVAQLLVSLLISTS